MKDFTLLDLAALAREAPADSILSRTLYSDEVVRAVLFSFATGQELSEHTASVPAVIHILQGEADLTLGGEHIAGRPGTWAHMAPNLAHSVHARTALTMLLWMFPRQIAPEPRPG